MALFLLDTQRHHESNCELPATLGGFMGLRDALTSTKTISSGAPLSFSDRISQRGRHDIGRAGHATPPLACPSRVKQFVPFLFTGGLSVLVNVGSRILLFVAGTDRVIWATSLCVGGGPAILID